VRGDALGVAERMGILGEVDQRNQLLRDLKAKIVSTIYLSQPRA
jgi:hypothetical protein